MEKNKSGERKQIKGEKKKKIDCKTSIGRIEAEKQKVVVQQQKFDKSSTKGESRRIEELRVAENRQKKKAEKRSKN